MTTVTMHVIPEPEQRPCGGGIPQPAWRACGRPGVYRVPRLGGVTEHGYCEKHADLRVAAFDRLTAMRLEAEARRARDAR